MSAPTVADFLAGDFKIKNIWRDILRSAKLNAFARFDVGTKQTPYVEILFEETAATDHTYRYTVPGSDPPRVIVYHPVKNGSLSTTVCTTPGRNSDKQELIVGTIRACAEDFAALFNTDVLPWHGINLFKEASLKEYVDTEELLDKTELRHHIHFNVRSTSWALVGS
jgi:hypothetical protein